MPIQYDLLDRHTKQQQASSIANYAPSDCTMSNLRDSDTNYGKFALGLGQQLVKFEDMINLMTNEFGPDLAFYLLEEWERMLAIPDECFKINTTVAQRQKNALVKLAAMNAQTSSEFERTALLLGFTVEVLAGIDAINPPFDLIIPEITSDQDARNSIVVLFSDTEALEDEFPYTFPIRFGGPFLGVMQCVLTRMKPATSQIIFINTAT